MSGLLEKFCVRKDNVLFEVDCETFWKSKRRIVLPKYILDGSEKQNIIFSWKRHLKNTSVLLNNFGYEDKINREVVELDLSAVNLVMNPRKKLQDIIGRKCENRFYDEISYLYNIFQRLGIDSKDLGIGGSNLSGLSTPSSDIDLLIYGDESKNRLIDNLQALFEDEKIRPITKFRQITDGLYQKRKVHFAHLTRDYLLRHEQRRIQGLINDKVRFVVAFIREEKPKFFDRIEYIEPVVPVKIIGKIRNSTLASFDPAILDLKIKKLDVDMGDSANGTKDMLIAKRLVRRRIRAIFYNPIYSITYAPNEEIFVRGMLEKVRTVDSRTHYQIAIRYQDPGQDEVRLLGEANFSFWK